MKIRRILYPTDFSAAAGQALGHALFLAEQFEAELHMLHAVVLHDYDPQDPEQTFPEPSAILKQLFEIADSEMAKLAAHGKSKTFTVKEAKVRGFSAPDVIIDYAAEHDADLVVMGTHGRRGPARLLLGSVAAEVVRRAPCPVLTLRQQEKPRSGEALDRLLVPIDFSEHSRTALAHAKHLAALYGAALQLLHCVEEPAYPYFYAPIGGLAVADHFAELERKSLEALAKLAAETPGPEVASENFVAHGRASAEIVRFAGEHDSDMVVIATHGLTGLERMFLGSTAEEVVRGATVPVFTVRPFGKSLVD